MQCHIRAATPFSTPTSGTTPSAHTTATNKPCLQKKPLALYAGQLALNFAWQPLFFQAKRLDYALVDITGTLVLTAATAHAFHKVNPKAGYLMAPSVAWVAYAAALNASMLKKNVNPHKNIDTDKKSFAAALGGDK